MDKLKKAAASPASHGAAATRKHSAFDKDAASRTAQMAKHRTSSHDVSGSEPGEEDSMTDFIRNDFLAFKSSFARPKYANTYRMEPYRKCEPHIVRKKVEEILKNKLQDFKYNGPTAASTCTDITEDILEAVKALGFDRYKYIVQVFLVEKTGQSIHIASRWVWDVARDTWIQGQHETEDYVAVALIIACYYE